MQNLKHQLAKKNKILNYDIRSVKSVSTRLWYGMIRTKDKSIKMLLFEHHKVGIVIFISYMKLNDYLKTEVIYFSSFCHIMYQSTMKLILFSKGYIGHNIFNIQILSMNMSAYFTRSLLSQIIPLWPIQKIQTMLRWKGQDKTLFTCKFWRHITHQII